MVPAVLRDVHVRLVNARAFETRVVFRYNLTDFVRLCSVLVEVQWQEYQIRTQLLSNKPSHAGTAAKLPGDVVACRENTAPNGKWEIFQLGPIKLLDGSVEGVTVKMNNVLTQISGQVELGNKVVSLALLAGQVEFLKLASLFENTVDLDSEDLVPFLLAVEVFGAFRGIVYNLGDLRGNSVSLATTGA